MFNQTQAWREYLKRRENGVEQEKIRDLFNEKTFYRAFIKDLLQAKKEVIIYSPFVSKFRANFYQKFIEKLRKRNIEIFIFTRPLDEYDNIIRPQIERALENYKKQGINIFYLGKYIHEKVAIIDREILWEGSLNILSHRASNEMMRRTRHQDTAMQVTYHLNLNKKLADGYRARYEKSCHNLITNSKQDLKTRVRMFLLGAMTALLILLALNVFFNGFNIVFLIWKFWMK